MGLCGANPPDPSKGYEAGILADLETLPWQRILQAAAAEGTPATIQLPGRNGAVTPLNVDFTGYGQADYERQYADTMAQQMLDLQNQFGPEYVQERLAELKQSDPEGDAMRQKLWGAIQSDAAASQNTNRPAADELQNTILNELQQGGTLDPQTAKAVSQSVLGKQVAYGQYGGNAATTEEATALANATDQQRAQRQQEALAFLTSGATPADVAYRRQQQSIANLGSFLSGETPQAQFGQLSGAQNQIVPFIGGAQLSGVNPNAGWQGVDYANSLYSANMNWNNAQVNPWMAGIGGAARGLGVFAGLGGQIGPGVANPAPAAYGVNQGGWGGVDVG